MAARLRRMHKDISAKEHIHNIQKKNKTTWTRDLRYIGIVGFIIGLLFCIFYFSESIPLVVLSSLIAYLLHPAAKFLAEKLHINMNLSVIIVYVVLALLIVAAVIFITPRINQGINNFFQNDWPVLQASIEELIEELETRIDRLVIEKDLNIDMSEPLNAIQEAIHSFRGDGISFSKMFPDFNSLFQKILSVSSTILGKIISLSVVLVTSILASIRLCSDGHLLKNTITGMFKEKYRDEVTELLNRISNVWSRYFAGERKLMFCVGILSFIYFILGLRWAVVLGLIAGFCEIIPNIGPVLAAVPAVIIAFIFGSSRFPVNNFVVALLTAAAATFIQQAENVFIAPHVMSNALELHPVVLLLRMMALSAKLGFIGAVFAAPLLGMFKELIIFLIAKLKEEPPYPELLPDDPL